MASILTNSSSMAALSTLRSIGSQMSTTQERISSGLKVGSAADNAAYWSISTTMKTESSSLSVVGEALGMGSSLADISSTATQSIIDLAKQVRDRLTAAGEGTNDAGKLQVEIDQLNEQMASIVKSATFNGVSWLNATAAGGTTPLTETTVLSGVSKEKATNGTITTTLDTITIKLQSSEGAPRNVNTIVKDMAGVKTNAAAAGLTIIDNAIQALTEIGSRFGAASTRIDLQKDFISSLTDAIDRGVGSLVDADMNEESTRLKALQTQQQLAVQSLSIANSSSESILQLFR
ncbi:flagellin [Rhizobium pusense]|uniref:flagellin N-terminal helical domain-containing protein n=1 Tax=Agrobacterium pusense TaxID=648995 RepID=UPI000D1AAB50|nr:flagellin [Agrobacterium pusense]MDH0913072.1 flagellin [Agrobacterium pusense]MDH1099333.1 flagellin [Agrobacterium pusense]MDH1115905.1 flagellin [Agrobacterium pusense]MDH2197629.1 flagellin [Agrobacterium pusense]